MKEQHTLQHGGESQGNILLVLHATLGATVVPEAQRLALVDVYDALGGPAWSGHTGWLVGDPHSDVCLWTGVSCTVGADTVTGLILRSREIQGVSGSLPASVSGLLDLGCVGCSPSSSDALVCADSLVPLLVLFPFPPFSPFG